MEIRGSKGPPKDEQQIEFVEQDGLGNKAELKFYQSVAFDGFDLVN